MKRVRIERDWATLEALPLSLILDKLEERIDHVWFSVVCKNWQSIAKLNHQNQQFNTNKLPMLMIPAKNNKNKLFSIPNKRPYPFQFQSYFAKTHKFLICGSSHGWFALLDDSKSIITLMNPFKDTAHINLPSLDNNVHKITLFADPMKNPDDYVVVAIYGKGNLAFIRASQKNWTYLDTSKSCFIDVIFYKSLKFALNIRNKIMSFNLCCLNDISGEEKITSNVVLEENVYEYFYRDKFLVKSLNEELWMVKRCDSRMSTFDVYKLKLDAKSEKVEQIFKLKSLEDNILFLGRGDSISVSKSYFSESLESDSIYFEEGLKIYDMKSESAYYNSHNWKSSFWILPYFQWD